VSEPTTRILNFPEASAARFDLRCWGEFSLFDRLHHREVAPRRRKARALIAFLASHNGAAVGRERLCGLLWSERGDQQARASLRQTLLELKPLVTEAPCLVVVERDLLRLNAPGLTSDLARLEAQARNDDLEGLAQGLAERGDRLYGGLDGLDPAFDEWLAAERRLQRDRLLSGGVAAAERGLKRGAYAAVAHLATELQALDETDETVAQLGMRADHARGDHGSLRRRHRQLGEALKRDLGVAPSVETETLLGQLDATEPTSEAAAATAESHAAVEQAPVAGQPDAGQTPAAGTPVAKAETGARFRWSRRAMGAGLVAAGGTALAVAAWLRTRPHVPDPRAIELYRRGQVIQKAGDFETMGQALGYYKQAVSIDPRYAEAWGALALSYRYPVIGPVMRLGDPQEVRTAAQRALALDPDNADARLALIALYPLYRRWQEREAQLRALLRDNPDYALGHVRLGELLVEVGRIEDAVIVAEHAIGIDATRQICWFTLAVAYYFAGRDHEGDVAIEEARSRWPQDRRLYARGYSFIRWSKRYKEALAYIGDTSRRPRLVGRELAEFWMRLANAQATGRGLAEFKNRARTSPVSLELGGLWYWAPDLALLGMVDELFALLEAYFFGGIVNGERVAPPGPLDTRPSVLFAPAVLSLRNDPRFASLLARTGLEDYWRKSGAQPDFRLR
jgi:DNA-binding SARP family transcriptional activator